MVGGDCAACSKKKESAALQRAAIHSEPVNEAPPIVSEVLRLPGQPLDAATRAYFEPRFGHDFSRVRVHTDAGAAQSAAAVNAYAYTVGRDMVFGAGLYQPKSERGRQLLAHELTHVVQQSAVNSAAPLTLGDPHSPAEREADEIAAHVHQSASSSPHAVAPRAAVYRDARPAIRRWKVTGDTAVSDSDSDTLGGLAKKAGAHFNDWKCIKPVSQRTSTHAKPPANFNARYELYVQKGDEFDISNLTATTGTSLSIYLFSDGSEAMDAAIVRKFYPGSKSSSDADNDIDIASSSGSKPISNMVIFGHAGGSSMWGNASTFTPSSFNPEKEVQTFALASVGLFPRRCFFTRNASVRSVGCDSETWGEDFAGHYLRDGASVTTTTKSVRPKCKKGTITGGCTAYDGLDFATSWTTGATSLDGPFWTASDFHAGKYWKTIKGKL
jgi:hypothetical protein